MRVLFQDQEVIVIDKPTGVSVHNQEEKGHLLQQVSELVDGAKLYPVHRLDKETSGVQIFALNERSARKLAEEFQNRRVNKIYVGILQGQIKTGGVWDKPLSDKSEGRRNPQGLSRDRVPCTTEVQIIETQKYFTYCQFNPLTGRQHQIRKHAALARHPLVGDARYGDSKYNRKIAELYKRDRLFLHCREIEIVQKKFQSPVPEDFSILNNGSLY